MSNTLGKTGLKVNPIGFGGIPIQRLSMEESDKVITAALEQGINFFDTSRVYTDSEEKLGRVFSRYQRDKIIMASKTFSRDGASAVADLETGLKLLKTDYIDIYQAHNISQVADLEKILAPGGVLEVLEKAKKEGKIRFIGLTGHKPPILMKGLEAFNFDTVQVPMNYIEQSCFEQVIPFAKEKGLGVIAMKPVAGGAFQPEHIPLVFRFTLNKGADVLIPGMDDVKQVAANLSVLQNLTPLTAQETALLEQVKAELGSEFCRRCEYCMPCPEGLPIAFLHILRAYYLRYNLKGWVMERLANMPKTFQDCTQCGQCIVKCPYDLDSPRIFKETLEIIRREQAL